ncbi:helix-turn-helix transcriptional regulator [Alcaligenes sp. SDU_A2]|uniref:helix-turn-helix transcriptional regulator n=1 Tax=Alcaligenes sp. SDU_A2 TaxID=3136634 RepID=UPI002C78E158|nr:helix-turn-helix transcriptional regulator [Alcaligenes sp.]HRL26339.1 helix-turn-helix transcriptional regulator [Alcaligenes sp.]
MAHLTTREQSCLNWASHGKTSWEISIILGVTERTINFHLQNAYAKLGVYSRQAAITLALQQRLITGDPTSEPKRQKKSPPARHPVPPRNPS